VFKEQLDLYKIIYRFNTIGVDELDYNQFERLVHEFDPNVSEKQLNQLYYRAKKIYPGDHGINSKAFCRIILRNHIGEFGKGSFTAILSPEFEQNVKNQL